MSIGKEDLLTVSSTPPDDGLRDLPTPAGAANEKTGRHKRPVVWMVITAVAVVAVIGLGLWALKVHSDLEASQSDLAAQTAATEAAQAQVAAQTEAAQAAAAELEKINAGNEVYVVSDEDVAQAESDVAAAQKALDEANVAAAEANNAVTAAQDEASKLRAQLQQARAERDLAQAERQQARVCARGSLGVISGLGKSNEQATQEMETVSSACAATVPG